jgi:hypothetical protein
MDDQIAGFDPKKKFDLSALGATSGKALVTGGRRRTAEEKRCQRMF